MDIGNLLKLAIPLFVVHAIEEYSTGFLGLDPLFRSIATHHLPTIAIYVVEQLLLVAILLWAMYQPQRWLLVFIGLLFIFEASHVIPALAQTSYYPGLLTAVLLLLLGFFYWRAVILRFTTR